MSQFMSVATTDARPPTTGTGGASAVAVSTFVAATVFVPAGPATAGAWPTGPFVASVAANTIDGAWGGGALTPAVGDMIIDNQGGVLKGWGIIKKITADAVTISGPTVYDVIEVDAWHGPFAKQQFSPAAGDDLGLWRGVYNPLAERAVIDWIDFTANTQITAQALTICDLAGVAIPGLLWANQAQVAAGLVYQPNLHQFASGHNPDGMTSIELNQLFTVKTANATSTALVGFRMIP